MGTMMIITSILSLYHFCGIAMADVSWDEYHVLGRFLSTKSQNDTDLTWPAQMSTFGRIAKRVIELIERHGPIVKRYGDDDNGHPTNSVFYSFFCPEQPPWGDMGDPGIPGETDVSPDGETHLDLVPWKVDGTPAIKDWEKENPVTIDVDLEAELIVKFLARRFRSQHNGMAGAKGPKGPQGRRGFSSRRYVQYQFGQYCMKRMHVARSRVFESLILNSFYSYHVLRIFFDSIAGTSIENRLCRNVEFERGARGLPGEPGRPGKIFPAQEHVPEHIRWIWVEYGAGYSEVRECAVHFHLLNRVD